MRIPSGKGGWSAQAGLLQPGRVGGFTYISLLIIIAIMGVVMGTAGEVWHMALKREKEQELLFAWDQFRHAIKLYYEHTLGQGRRYPASLEDLLMDPRYPSTQRYLRKIYIDPVRGSTEWGLVKGPAGEIFGVYSLSEEEPVKKSNFKLADKDFEGRTKYTDWVFKHIPSK